MISDDDVKLFISEEAATIFEPVAGDPEYLPQQFKQVGVEMTWPHSDGSNVTIAIMADGIGKHPDLAGQVIEHKDFSGQSTPGQQGTIGTALAGLIAGKLDRKGIVGVAHGAKLIDAQIFGPRGGGSTVSVIRALDWLTKAHKPEVIVMPFQSGGQSFAMKEALERAQQSGAFLVADGGHGGSRRVYPAAYDCVMSVRGLGDSSQPNDYDEILSPSGRYKVASPEGGFKFLTLSGISVIAGAAAMLKSARPDYSPERIRSVLTRSGSIVDGFNIPLINVWRAVVFHSLKSHQNDEST